MLASKVIIAAVIVMTLYFGFRDDPSWFQGAALLALIGGGYIASMHTYRIELDDRAVQIRSVYGRTRIELSEVKQVTVSHLASSAPFALTFHRTHGAPITWKVVLFGKGSAVLIAALGQRFHIDDEGRTGFRYL